MSGNLRPKILRPNYYRPKILAVNVFSTYVYTGIPQSWIQNNGKYSSAVWYGLRTE